MNRILEPISDAWSYFVNQIRAMGVSDVIDILIVSVLLYYVYVFIRERRAGKLAIGVGVLVFIQIISSLFDLVVMNYFLKNIFQVGIIAAFVIFQPELRSMLERVGGDSIRSLRSIGEDKTKQEVHHFVDEVCEAVGEMSRSKVGALIVIERTTRLGDIIATGTVINADVSSMLLRNIFFDKSPLHDGAVVIREMRIHAAGCLLPLATKNDITKELGTRHRAAIGASESSDALVIVVSEETGTVSLAYKGSMIRGYDTISLKSRLDEIFIDQRANGKKKSVKKMLREDKSNNSNQ